MKKSSLDSSKSRRRREGSSRRATQEQAANEAVDENGNPLPRGPERFYYDKSTFTGAHKAGGPVHYDDDGGGGYSDLKNLIARDHVQNDALQRKKAQGIVKDPHY